MVKLIQFSKVTGEFLVTLFFSLFPIFFGSFVSAMWTSSNMESAILSNFSGGEVFIYTSAFLTPYILFRYKESGSRMLREFCFILFLYALVVGAFLFVSVRLEALLSVKMNVNKEYITYVGYTIVGTTLVLWYYSTWPNYKVPLDPIKLQSDQAQKLDADLSKLIDKGAGQ